MKENELDEELQLVFASSPNRIVRHGNSIIILILGCIIGLGFFIKFPETVNGNVALYSSPSAATIVSKSSGRLRLQVKDGEQVQKDDILGYVETPANVNHVIFFSKFIDSLNRNFSSDKVIYSQGALLTNLNLGDLNPFYISLVTSLNALSEHSQYNNFLLNKKDLENQIEATTALIKQYRADKKLAFSELLLILEKLKRDSLLYSKKVISLAEFENSRLSTLPYQRKYEALTQTLITATSQIQSLKSQTFTIGNDKTQKDLQLLAEVKSAIINAKTQTDLWMERNVLRTPIIGKVAILNTWNSLQNVNSSEEVMSILPAKQGVVAKASIVAAGSGKLQVSDKAIIQLDDYPQEEFGVILGEVKSLPAFQRDGQYVVLIDLKQGLVTNFKKSVPLKEGMTGTVKIVTNDITLIERIFYNTRKAISSFEN